MSNTLSVIESLEIRTLLSTNIVADIGGMYPTEAVSVDGISYFAANDGVHGIELWKSDGTEGATSMVKDLIPGDKSSRPQMFASVNDHVVFMTVLKNRAALWTSDGTEAGTLQLIDLGRINSDLASFGIIDGSDSQHMIIAVNLGSGDEGDPYATTLWSSDGTIAGTKLVRVLDQRVNQTANYYAGGIPIAGERAILLQENARLVHTDGTPEGTGEFWTGSYIRELTPMPDGTVVFGEDSGVERLWRTDGTAAGTHQIATLGLGGTGGMWQRVGDNLFIGQVYGDEQRIWVVDATVGATIVWESIGLDAPGPMLATTGQKLIFLASDADHGRELWSSDGTAAGTQMVADITPGSADSNIGYFVPIDGVAYFVRYVYDASTETVSHELWKSDGTTAGTGKIAAMQDLQLEVGPTVFSFSLTAVQHKLVITQYGSGYLNVIGSAVYDPSVDLAVPVNTARMRLKDRKLRIFGTGTDDTIRIYRSSSDPTRFVVNLNDTFKTFPIDGVRSIYIYGYGGDDSIAFFDGKGVVPITSHIWSGNGNDTVFGGSASDTISGGNGSDRVASGAGDDLVMGGGGADSINAGAGDDVATGDAGPDRVKGGDGNDIVGGGDTSSRDHLDGGAGLDVLFGQAVFEIFYSVDSDESEAVLIG